MLFNFLRRLQGPFLTDVGRLFAWGLGRALKGLGFSAGYQHQQQIMGKFQRQNVGDDGTGSHFVAF